MTVLQHWPTRLLTLDEWVDLTLPGDLEKRAELVEGVLVLSPAPTFRHQQVMLRLGTQLDAALDGPWAVLPEPDVVVEGGPTPTVRRPDLGVVPAAFVADHQHCAAADVLAAFELLSPGTRRVDRVMKMHEYALGGIPFYGIVDVDGPVTLTEFRLVGDVYERVAQHRGRAELGLGVTLDLEQL